MNLEIKLLLITQGLRAWIQRTRKRVWLYDVCLFPALRELSSQQENDSVAKTWTSGFPGSLWGPKGAGRVLKTGSFSLDSDAGAGEPSRSNAKKGLSALWLSSQAALEEAPHQHIHTGQGCGRHSWSQKPGAGAEHEAGRGLDSV